MPEPSLFHGIAVIIDDEIDDATKAIYKIKQAIENEGCHVVRLSELPHAKGVPNFREASFFVLDWNLYGAKLKTIAAEDGITIPETMAADNEADIIKFLRELKKVRFAPVFIFTDEPVESVREKLRAYSDIYDEADPSHLLVMSKSQVNETGLFEVLSTWMKSAPSVYVLKKWEKAYEKAKNDMFLDFYMKSAQWPMVLWKNFDEDSVPPAALIGDLISRNLASRMAPFDCDLAKFAHLEEEIAKDQAAYQETVRKVFEGERFIADTGLIANAFAPGDIFSTAEGYFINIRPICDCIARGNTKVDTIELYLLRGTEVPLSELKYDRDNGLIPEKDNESFVFPVFESKALCFKYRKIYTKKWKDLKTGRIGRLLPPYLTRLQQRFSAYLQRPGLLRLPGSVFPDPPPDDAIQYVEPLPAPAAVQNNSPMLKPVEAPTISEPMAEPTAAAPKDAPPKTSAMGDGGELPLDKLNS